MGAPIRHLVLDNEAASALLSDRPQDAKRAAVLHAIMSANGRSIVPTAVRCEVGWARRDAAAANANRLVPVDDPLDRAGADRDVELRRAVPSASLVDAAVVVAAERLPAADVVEILTSDPYDLRQLRMYADVHLDVQRL